MKFHPRRVRIIFISIKTSRPYSMYTSHIGIDIFVCMCQRLRLSIMKMQLNMDEIMQLHSPYTQMEEGLCISENRHFDHLLLFTDMRNF